MRSVLVTLTFTFAAAAQTVSPLRQFSDEVANLSARIRTSVVQVVGNGYSPETDETGAAAVRRSAGSGVIIGTDGYIVTNAHVVRGTTRLQVYLPATRKQESGKSIVKPRGPVLPAKVLGIDSETDLALLKVEATQLTSLSFADSDQIRQGQVVLAFGHPLGLEEAVGMGVISAVARQLKPDDPVIYLQTDAPINPGNSGGPLVDMDGRIVGVNTLILSQSGGSEGVGFAIPSNIVRTITDQLRTYGRVRRSFIGAQAQTITPGLAAGLGLPRDSGVVLADVLPNSPADVAGLEVGDIVLALNGKRMENARQFQVNLYRQPPLTEINLSVLRNGAERIHKVQVVELPGDPGRLSKLVDEKIHNVPRLGVLAVTLDGPIRDLLTDLRKDEGVLVASRAVSATDAEGLLHPGDVIYSFDKQPLRTLEQLRTLLDQKQPGDTAVLQIERDGSLKYLEVPLD